MTKSHKKTKSSFICTVYHCSPGTKYQLVIFAEPKYNIFCYEKLHTDRIQHYLCYSIFFIFEMFKFECVKIWAPWSPSSKRPHSNTSVCFCLCLASCFSLCMQHGTNNKGISSGDPKTAILKMRVEVIVFVFYGFANRCKSNP
jgi:hypothetical protein